jgi:hypothetical protein
LSRTFPHVGFEFEEGSYSLCLQDGAQALAAGLAGVHGIGASAAFEASVIEIQFGNRAATIGADE